MARRRKRKSGKGFWGPFPSCTRRTRSGREVRITGCCLPLALGVAAVPAVLLRVLLALRRR